MTDARPDASGVEQPAPGTPGGRPAGATTQAAGAEATPETGSPFIPLVAGAGLFSIGVVLLTQVFAIDADGYSLAGPRFFPLVVLTLLTALSAVYMLQQALAIARRSGLRPVEPFRHMPAAAALVALLVVYALVLGTVGYVLATSVFFIGAARAMGSRHLTRDVVIGIGLSLLVYLVFTRALGVFLPEGVLPL
ncbi:tripartite tricarboxylate transporter TctB family protein [Nocardioides mesophilus]|uniref:Tripartite tricarboxylate transporter TctB family protein n=1 Tax=Nocardioides mesophilus TaxID=433659 RepID=A0A7G9RE20_9ACTN|nr:tripartite tricarboxylate transporter TctB family protein [Nocardioides mesophilus]QNN53845.1 tripartite tricarboxylate transporter TctB family protein [Nocardioides mesophilus]